MYKYSLFFFTKKLLCMTLFHSFMFLISFLSKSTKSAAFAFIFNQIQSLFANATKSILVFLLTGYNEHIPFVRYNLLIRTLLKIQNTKTNYTFSSFPKNLNLDYPHYILKINCVVIEILLKMGTLYFKRISDNTCPNKSYLAP